MSKIELTKTELTLKKNIRTLRISLGKTPYAVAKELKIDKAYYYRLEDDSIHKTPGYVTLEKLATYFNVEVCDLFKQQ